MKRATEKFIMRQNGESTGIIARLAGLDKKKILIGVGVVLVALIFAGLYLWYVRDFRAHKNLDLELQKNVPYKWSEDYGDEKINKGYLWSRTKELMLENRSNQTLILSYYILPGTLYEQEGVESDLYSLEDQALLLKTYLNEKDPLSATTLVNEVNNYFDLESEDTRAKLEYLDAYLLYYSMYGKSKDLDVIKTLVADVFDDEGCLKPSPIFIEGYVSKAYVGADDKEAALAEGGVVSDLENNNTSTSSQDSNVVAVDGVLVGDIKLLLIRNLENNKLLPEGSYERNLELVMNAKLDDDSGLFSNAYRIEDGKVVYFQTGYSVAMINVFETVLTMRNLSEVGSLPKESLAWVTTSLNSPEGINHNGYKILDKTFTETADNRVFYLVLQIAINVDNEDMFLKVLDKLDMYRATYHNSPALNMIFSTTPSGRNVCYAWENLMLASTL